MENDDDHELTPEERDEVDADDLRRELDAGEPGDPDTGLPPGYGGLAPGPEV